MSERDFRGADAKMGFLILQVMRLSGLAFALFGAAILARKVPLPAPAGYVLIVLGAIEATLVPTLIARKWKSR